MKKELTLYHGSPFIIKEPLFGKGNPNNDYGLGFYCTEYLELAKEWACSEETDGYANKYSFELTDLAVLDLSDGKYHILNWLAILLENRKFRIVSDVAVRAKEHIRENFLPAYERYDVIKGYRADDSYFSFATAFLNNTISLTQLEKAMVFGKLGEQVVPKTMMAFEQIKFVDSVAVDKAIYYPKKMARDNEARIEFKKEKVSLPMEQDTYVIDIIREGWENDDTRLQRIVSR